MPRCIPCENKRAREAAFDALQAGRPRGAGLFIADRGTTMPQRNAPPTPEPSPAEVAAMSPQPPTVSEADQKPEGWEKLRREGDPSGGAEVGYDAKRQKAYHLNSAGDVIYHEVPTGFHYVSGELQPIKEG